MSLEINRKPDESTVEWYVQWLEETRPDWTPEQRLEIATGFSAAQLPPERPLEQDEEPEQTGATKADERKEERRYLTGKELERILAIGTDAKV